MNSSPISISNNNNNNINHINNKSRSRKFLSIFYLCYLLLHLFISVILWLFQTFQQLKVILYILLPSPIISELQMIKRHLVTFPKVPIHLAFVLDNSSAEIPMDEIIRFALWGIACGIHYITFYDIKGILKSKIEQFQKQMEKAQQKLSNSAEFIIKYGPIKVEKANEYCISLISAVDSRIAIVQAAKKICNTVKEGALEVKSINDNTISKNLPFYGIPEPDLLLQCDNSQVQMGFLPWHIRLSDIKQFGTLKVASCYKYLSTLKQFTKTVQRHGA